MDLQRQRPPICIDHGVPLSAFDLLPRIIAARTASLRRFHALTVDDGRTRACFTPNTLTVEHDQVVIDRLPNANIAQVTNGIDEALNALRPGLTGLSMVAQP